eukprot:gene12461-14257_t
MFRSIVSKAAADHFQVLGVSRTCNDDEVKKAYLKLAKEWHPDVNKAPEASDKFKVISDAYDNLKDEVRRSHYRAELQYGRTPGQYGQPGQYSPYQNYHGPYEHTDGRPESFHQRIRNFFCSRANRWETPAPWNEDYKRIVATTPNQQIWSTKANGAMRPGLEDEYGIFIAIMAV